MNSTLASPKKPVVKPAPKPRKTLATKITQLRKERGLSITALAELSGLNLSSVSAIEAGTRMNPGADTLISLATGLRISLDELLSYDVSALPPEPVKPTTIEGVAMALEALRADLNYALERAERVDAIESRLTALEGK